MAIGFGQRKGRLLSAGLASVITPFRESGQVTTDCCYRLLGVHGRGVM